ncbi:diaminopimelate decarboxylase [Pseudanabaena sp. FACHB-1998]|uniref:diaminopimelate decarboxylase n=1 Tax=Pseudanabaena sp. FACHB-1998 TaxID=2692858 RepID=UPI00168059C6|nr:diaminopimelate decarboxylase [Pseudanabaena sp. FACHB-1998]MBD2177673.1 diaminopimelate decarboxylase [Pseudanabaena sp. FACHB-1998]
MTTVLTSLRQETVISNAPDQELKSLQKLSPNQQLLPLTAVVNANDHLEIGGCDVVDLVSQYGSPLYILDEMSLRTACQQYRDALVKHYQGQSQVLYASKAWSCLAVCAIAGSEGLGIDVVSAGEILTATRAGVSPSLIYFHGNNKSLDELTYALESGCTIVVDNWHELKNLDRLAREQADLPSFVAPRIMLRLTPGIECHTHEYIRTGHIDSKFGFDPNEVESVFAFLADSLLNCIGIHAHIGSQIFELQPHQDIGGVMVQWFKLAGDKYGLNFSELNIGGGLGIRYVESDDPPSIEEWVKAVSAGVTEAFVSAGLALPKLLCEPGRSLVGATCITAYTIGGSKTVPDIRTYVTIDGGMSDNPRPITYQSQYRAVVANTMSAPLSQTVTIAGKHCESGDILIKDIQLPQTNAGDILVVFGTGAYNYSMASNYNRLPKPAAVVVADGEASLIIKRETREDLLRQDCLPEKLRK